MGYCEQMHGVTFKKRAPRAIKEIKAFAHKSMVRIEHLLPGRDTHPSFENIDPSFGENYWTKTSDRRNPFFGHSGAGLSEIPSKTEEE